MDVCLDVQKLRWWPFQKRRGPETVVQRPWHLQAASPLCLSVRHPREGQGRLRLTTLQHLESLHLPAESKRPAEAVSVFLSSETGMSGHFVGRIKGDKYRFELQFLKWDFS